MQVAIKVYYSTAARSVKHRGKAKKAWKALWEEADAAGFTA